MTRVVVTGGTGTLGREVVRRLAGAGYTVRVMSRRPRPADLAPGLEWAQADLLSRAGLREAVLDVHIIVHAATGSPAGRTRLIDTWFGRVDIDGTQRLLEQARAAGVAHLIYISIVGIDRIPFIYYRHKLAAEALVERGGVPWSILRATQFHTLIDIFLRQLDRLPLFLLPSDLRCQPIDAGEVADRLCAAVAAPPAGRLPDTGGPEVLAADEMAKAWLAVRGQRRRILYLPLPGKVTRGFRRGYNTCPDHKDGAVTWAEWLRRTYAPRKEPHVEALS
jgi:uncharacterized protein YbjT (DUF2867 family)